MFYHTISYFILYDMVLRYFVLQCPIFYSVRLCYVTLHDIVLYCCIFSISAGLRERLARNLQQRGRRQSAGLQALRCKANFRSEPTLNSVPFDAFTGPSSCQFRGGRGYEGAQSLAPPLIPSPPPPPPRPPHQTSLCPPLPQPRQPDGPGQPGQAPTARTTQTTSGCTAGTGPNSPDNPDKFRLHSPDSMTGPDNRDRPGQPHSCVSQPGFGQRFVLGVFLGVLVFGQRFLDSLFTL